MAQNLPSLKISLIVPTYNERENLPTLAEQVHKALEGYDYELIIVDEGSSSERAKITESLSGKYPIKLICCRGERSLASAVIAGFNQAKGEVFGVIEAGLHPAEKIPELLQAIQDGADIAIASRYIPGGGIEGWSTKQKAISRGIIMLARLVLPSIRKVKDPMSGLFLLRRKVIEGVELKPTRYKILLETLVRGRGWEVKEVPYIEEGIGEEGTFSLREQLNSLEHIFILATKERELRRFIQFCFVGLSGVGVNFGTFWLLTRGAGLWDLAAVILGWATATLSNFILNDIWTFRDRRMGTAKAILLRAAKFFLVSLGAIGVYYAVYTPLTRFLGVYDLVAYAIAIGIGLVWNFSINVLWTWRKGEMKTLSQP